LQRIFSTFPTGWPGVGLLGLRTATGTLSAAQGILLALHWNELTPLMLILTVGYLVIGALFVAGYLTPVAAGTYPVILVGVSVLGSNGLGGDMSASNVTTGLTVLVSLSILCLGPGAFSVDARLFGRREIIIPPTSHSQRR